jgi:hypothetical protein
MLNRWTKNLRQRLFWTTTPRTARRSPRRRVVPFLEPLENRITPNIHFDFHAAFPSDEAWLEKDGRLSLVQMAGDLWTSRITDHLDQADLGPQMGKNAITFEDGSSIEIPDLVAPVDTIPVFYRVADLPTTGDHPFLAKCGPEFDVLDANIVKGGGSDPNVTTRGKPGVSTADAFVPLYISMTINSSYDWYFGVSTTSGLDKNSNVVSLVSQDPRHNPSQLSDFLSVITHELGHGLGIGTSPVEDPAYHYAGKKTYTQINSDGSSNLHGDYDPYPYGFGEGIPLSGDGHIRDDTVDLLSGQICVMVPAIPPGVRRIPTTIDWAYLRDIGWTVSGGVGVVTVAMRFYNDAKHDQTFHDGEEVPGGGARSTAFFAANAALGEIDTFTTYNSDGLVVFTLPRKYDGADVGGGKFSPDSPAKGLTGENGYTTFKLVDKVFDTDVNSSTFGTLIPVTTPALADEVLFADVPFTRASSGAALVDDPIDLAIPASPLVTVSGQTADGNNSFTVKRSGTNLTINSSSVQKTQPLNGVQRVLVNGGSGTDTLVVDFSGGNPVPAGGLAFTGGGGQDQLTLRGKFSRVTYNRNGETSGSLQADGAQIDYYDTELVGIQATTQLLTLNHATYVVGPSIKVTSAVNVNDGGTLTGGSAGGITLSAGLAVADGGTVAPADPGTGVGILGTRTASFYQGSTLVIEMDGPSAGDGYSQLSVSGTVSLDNPTLEVHLTGFAPQAGQTFTIIANHGSAAVQGTFNGLAEGATFVAGGHRFRISYQGGAGNDVVLTALEEAPSLGGLTLSKSYITYGGTDVLTVTVTPPDPSQVDGVEFWLDLNHNGQIDDQNSDKLLKFQEVSGLSTYHFTGVIGGVGDGSYQVLVRAVRFAGPNTLYSDTLSANLDVVPAPPAPKVAIAVGSETRVNGSTLGNQGGGRVTFDGAGNSYVFWYNAFQEQSFENGYDSSGNPIVTTMQGIDGPIDDVAMVANGDFIVVWEIRGELVYTEFYADGSGAYNVLGIGGNYISGSARIAMTADHDFAIVWEHGSIYNTDIYLFRQSGGSTVFDGKVSTLHPSYSPAVGLDSSGNAFVVWTDDPSGGFGHIRLAGRLYGPDGNASTPELTVAAYNEDRDIVPAEGADAVAALPRGGFLVAYTDGPNVLGDGTGNDILAVRYTSAGNPIDAAPFHVNSYLAADQLYPRIAVEPPPEREFAPEGNHFVIAWTSFGQEVGEPSTEEGVFGQAFDANGNPLGGMFQANTTVSGNQSLAGVAMSSDGHFRVAWSGNGVGDDQGVFTQAFYINEAPTNITLSTPFVLEGHSVGSSVGTLAATDANVGDTSVFSFVNGRGLDNSAFSISGNQLLTATSFNYAAKSSYHVRIRATDQNGTGLSIDRDFVVKVGNVIPSSGGSASGTYTDSDGDSYTVKLTGPGTLVVEMADPNGDGMGSIQTLGVANSDPTLSSLTVTVKNGPLGDGYVNIGELEVFGSGSSGPVGLKSLNLGSTNFTGNGLLVQGNLASLTVHDVRGGASLSWKVAAGQSSTISAHVIADNSVITIGGPLAKLSAAAIGADKITATQITTLSVTGDAAGGLRGTCSANLTLQGNPNPRQPVLGTTVIAGDLTGVQWSLQGQVGPVTVKGDIAGSTIQVTTQGATDANGLPLNLKDGMLASLTAGKVTDLHLGVARQAGTVTVRQWSGGVLVADSLVKLLVTGNPAAHQTGVFSASVTLYGNHVAAGAATLGSVSVTGNTHDASFQVNGNVGTFTTGSFIDSTLWIGFLPGDPTVNPVVSPGTFTIVKDRLTSFNTTAKTDSIHGSSIVVDSAGSLALAGVSADTSLDPFGFAIQTTYTTLRVGGHVVAKGGKSYQAGSFHVVQLVHPGVDHFSVSFPTDTVPPAVGDYQNVGSSLTFTGDGSPLRLGGVIRLFNTSLSQLIDVRCRLTIDGTQYGHVRYTTVPANGYRQVIFDELITGLAAGVHTVQLQVNNGNLAAVRIQVNSTLNVEEFKPLPDGGPNVDMLSSSATGLFPPVDNSFHDAGNTLTFTAGGSPVRLSGIVQLTDFQAAPDLQVSYHLLLDGVQLGQDHYTTVPYNCYVEVALEELLSGLAPGDHTLRVEVNDQSTTLRIDNSTLNVEEFHDLSSVRPGTVLFTDSFPSNTYPTPDNAYHEVGSPLTFTANGNPLRLSALVQISNLSSIVDVNQVSLQFTVDGVAIGHERYVTLAANGYAEVYLEELMAGLAPGKPHTIGVDVRTPSAVRVDDFSQINVLEEAL